MYQRILVPIDGSSRSLHTLGEAVTLASGFGSGVTLTVFHVNVPIALNDLSVGIDLTKVVEDEGLSILARAQPLLDRAPFAHDLRSVTGDPAQEICDLAKEGQYDLIVIGTRGHGLFTELLLGSVSHKVIAHAPCPVLVIRP